MIMNLSYHAEVERAERIELLAEYIGFTRIVMEVVLPDRNRVGKFRKIGLTSSGIMIIRNMEELVITAYLPQIDEVVKLSRKAGKKQVPPKLYNKVLKNMERHPELLRI